MVSSAAESLAGSVLQGEGEGVSSAAESLAGSVLQGEGEGG